MTWLSGQTTWDDVVDDIVKLACGEMSDGSAISVDPDDQWIRDTPLQNLIRSPATEDISLPDMSNRAGYWTLTSPGGTPQPTPFVCQSVCRQTGCFSGVPTLAVSNRWVMRINVTTTNSVAHNYSNMAYTYTVFDADTGTQLYTATSQTPNAAGVDSITIGTRTLELTFSDPSGIIITGTTWHRGFTSVYLGGIDWFGLLFSRRTASPTFSVAPSGGTSPTDWAIVEIGAAAPAGSMTLNVPGAILAGLGIKTNTGLNGAKYTCTWDISWHTLRMVRDTTASLNGRIYFEWQGGIADDGTGTYRQAGGLIIDATAIGVPLRPYQTPSLVTDGSLIQYWISVKPRKIVVILNANPGESGKLTCAMIGEYNPTVPDVDINPAMATGHAADYLIDNPSTNPFIQQMSLLGWGMRQDGSESPRDWQTLYMRSDIVASSLNTSPWGSGQHYQTLTNVGLAGTSASNGSGIPPFAPGGQYKPAAINENWWLYGSFMTEVYTITTNFHLPNNQYARGYLGGPDCPVYWIPGMQWSSGDELTDTNTSKVYFLVAADYHGILHRTRYNTNQFTGGVALLEE